MRSVEITYRCGDDDAEVRPRPADALAARRRLNEGNRAFAGLFETAGAGHHVIPISSKDFGLAGSASGAPLQRPFAAVLGCADARVPIEMVFNEGPNDLFVVRVAGNTLGDDVQGSLRYAVDHLGASLKLVVVLGHSGCGAVTAAVDVFLDPSGYLDLVTEHSIRELVDRLQIVVQLSARRMEAILGAEVRRQPGYRNALIEVAVVINAALAAHTLRRDIIVDPGAIEMVYGVFLLNERKVWAPRSGRDDVDGLAAPPSDAAGFAAFGDAVVRSQRIRALLEAAA